MLYTSDYFRVPIEVWNIMSVKIIVNTYFAETYAFLGGKAVNRKL